MSWWRRDPSLAPTRLDTRRILRSHEAALRTRCFSRSPAQHAQHEEDPGGKRPAGMSNLEWMQIQHYKHWQKRFTEDPYNAIFGASNDMLAGKGLKDWEWVSKSFPKWMLREMDSVKEYMKVPLGEQDKKSTHTDTKPVEHERASSLSPFPQSSLRGIRLDRDDTTGVASPSDLRRPREEPHVKVVGRSPPVETATTERDQPYGARTMSGNTEPPQQDTDSGVTHFWPMETTRKEASEREASLIDQFLATKIEDQSTPSISQSKNTVWRQTALQRRALRNLAPHSKYEAVTTGLKSNESNTVAHTPPGSGASVDARIETRGAEADTAAHPIEVTAPEQITGQAEDDTHQTTARKLDQLPKDDIDFISADEIRAAMRARKRKYRSDQEKAAEWKKLDHAFQTTAEPSNVDVMIEAKAVNDQMIRRLKREMAEPEEPMHIIEAPSKEQASNAAFPERPPVGSSIERIRKWFEQGGSVFASAFWQDPTEEADAKKTRVFFDKAVARIRQGRVAMRQVVEDLETDLPAAQPLIKRMKQDEELLDSAIHGLRTRSQDGKVEPLLSGKIRAIQTLRVKFERTDRELEKACLVLHEAATSDAVAATTSAFKRRLAIASRITQKNADLTRYLIWSLQARLEDPGINKNVLADYKAVANSLLTLRDTQMALARLLDHALLVYKVEAPKALEVFSTISHYSCDEVPEYPATPKDLPQSQISKTQIRADVAAEERLAHEVEAQKTAMRGLSDDGYTREPKSPTKKPIEERSALAHSLFRPFGPALESLTKDTSAQALRAEEQAKKASHDANLVAEVRAAYEDTYGPITVGHKQFADAAEEVKESQSEVKQFEMLKEDPISPSAHTDTVPLSKEAEKSFLSANASAESSVQPVTQPAEVHEAEIVQEANTSTRTAPSASPSVTAVQSDGSPDTKTSEKSTPLPELSNLPTHYTILLYNAQSDSVTVSTSISPPPRDTTPIIALPQALSTLDVPAKFIPHIPEGLEIVSAKKDMLVFRDSLATFKHDIRLPSKFSKASIKLQEEEALKRNVNPIDGTARLSPTGYVGPEESQEQLEKEFQERRQQAGALNGARARNIAEVQALIKRRTLYREREAAKEKRKGGAGSVVKTAIWAAATCYVFGVIGEVVSGA